MGEVVNLNQHRKRLAREKREAEAEANRAAHGRTKAEKTAAAKERDQIERTVDGAKRETGDDTDSSDA